MFAFIFIITTFPLHTLQMSAGLLHRRHYRLPCFAVFIVVITTRDPMHAHATEQRHAFRLIRYSL